MFTAGGQVGATMSPCPLGAELAVEPGMAQQGFWEQEGGSAPDTGAGGSPSRV